MPRTDDEFEDDDRPRRRREPDDEDQPRRRSRDDDGYRAPPPKSNSTGLILGILGGVLLLCCGGGGYVGWRMFQGGKAAVEQLQAVVQKAQDEQVTIQSRTNLRQIGLAMQIHHDRTAFFRSDSYSAVPKKGPAGQASTPLLSWRVHLLPHLDQEALYHKFKLDESWDSPNNRPLVSQIPDVYTTPDTKGRGGIGFTFYRGFSHKGAMFERPTFPNVALNLTMAQVQDGTSNTIMVVEAGEGIEWTRPDEFEWGDGRPKPKFGGLYPERNSFLVLFVNGDVRAVRRDVPDATLRLLLNRQDGFAIPDDWEAK